MSNEINKVWAVVGGDNGCDDPKYYGWVELFHKREDAVRKLEENVATEEESLEVKAKWNHNRTMATVEDEFGNPRICYSLQELEIA